MKMFLLVTALVTLSSPLFAADKASTNPAAVAVDQACTAEAQTAGCGNEQVGTGLLKCLHAYKKANKEFKFTDGCKAAMKTLHQEHKDHKGHKPEMAK